MTIVKHSWIGVISRLAGLVLFDFPDIFSNNDSARAGCINMHDVFQNTATLVQKHQPLLKNNIFWNKHTHTHTHTHTHLSANYACAKFRIHTPVRMYEIKNDTNNTIARKTIHVHIYQRITMYERYRYQNLKQMGANQQHSFVCRLPHVPVPQRMQRGMKQFGPNINCRKGAAVWRLGRVKFKAAWEPTWTKPACDSAVLGNCAVLSLLHPGVEKWEATPVWECSGWWMFGGKIWHQLSKKNAHFELHSEI